MMGTESVQKTPVGSLSNELINYWRATSTLLSHYPCIAVTEHPTFSQLAVPASGMVIYKMSSFGKKSGAGDGLFKGVVVKLPSESPPVLGPPVPGSTR